jgi:hypothetical protein
MLVSLSPRRRLPVLQTKDGEDSPPRPRWQWVAFGAVVILLVWLPLAYATQSLVARTAASYPQPLTAEDAEKLAFVAWLVPTAAVLAAGALGGYVLARWGDRAGLREAAEAGGVVALFAIGLSWARTGASATSLVAVLVVVPGALGGAILGRKKPAR